MKRCPRCSLEKPLDQFVRNRSAAGGIGAYCRPCHNKMGRQNRAKIWGGSRYYHLKARYGISRDTFEEMWERQGGLCAICLRELPSHVDHDHSTGQVRGLLCFRCNAGLGQFGDDTMTLAMAIGYLDMATPEAGHRMAQAKRGK